MSNSFSCYSCSRHQSFVVGFLTQFGNTFLDNGWFTLVHQTDLVLVYVHTNHLMTKLGTTCRAYASYVAETKNTNVHDYLN